MSLGRRSAPWKAMTWAPCTRESRPTLTARISYKEVASCNKCVRLRVS